MRSRGAPVLINFAGLQPRLPHMNLHRLFVLGFAATACAVGFSAPTDSAVLHSVIVDPNSSDPEIVNVRKAGDEAIGLLSTRMVQEITSAVARRGEEAALDVAHLKQIPMTNGRVEGFPNITAIKTTSYRVRAPKNKPDSPESLVLERFLGELKAGRPPADVVVQRIDRADKTHEWRVYRSLVTQPICLSCHGDLFNRPASFREKLESRYPLDQATEYKSNEWRGLMRVTVDLAAPKPAALEKAAMATPAKPE
jgi:hypothetical protein